MQLFVWRGLVGFAVLVLSTCGEAALVSYDLDQSNVLSDGTAYLRVTIDDQGLPGRINFNVSVLGPLLDIAGQNFGLQKFGFNSQFSLSSANVVGLPGNWHYGGSGNMSEFGRYAASLEANTGNARLSALSFSITGLSQETISSYLLASSSRGGNESLFFAAHVAGIDIPGEHGVTSGYFAGSAPSLPGMVPLPASARLLLAGLGVLACFFLCRPSRIR
jgi:hypothetical protein